jgi:hypothetical protein
LADRALSGDLEALNTFEAEILQARHYLIEVFGNLARDTRRQDAKRRPSSNHVLSSSRCSAVAMAIVDWRRSDGIMYVRQIGIQGEPTATPSPTQTNPHIPPYTRPASSGLLSLTAP